MKQCLGDTAVIFQVGIGVGGGHAQQSHTIGKAAEIRQISRHSKMIEFDRKREAEVGAGILSPGRCE